jgi:hypothetical protein
MKSILLIIFQEVISVYCETNLTKNTLSVSSVQFFKVQSDGTRDLHFPIKGQKLINALAHIITQAERSE